jgi:hypothetical protein
MDMGCNISSDKPIILFTARRAGDSCERFAGCEPTYMVNTDSFDAPRMTGNVYRGADPPCRYDTGSDRCLCSTSGRRRNCENGRV